MLRAALAALILAASAPAHAEAPAPAACAAPEFHQWDFWLGSWRVTDPDGVFQGTNEITRPPSGCGLLERWTSANGAPGASFNAYDPVRKTWTQLWAGAGSVIRLEGKLDSKGAMRMQGTIAYYVGGPERAFRGVWTPLPDGSVRQAFFERDPKTRAWSNWFTGLYRRAP